MKKAMVFPSFAGLVGNYSILWPSDENNFQKKQKVKPTRGHWKIGYVVHTLFQTKPKILLLANSLPSVSQYIPRCIPLTSHHYAYTYYVYIYICMYVCPILILLLSRYYPMTWTYPWIYHVKKKKHDPWWFQRWNQGPHLSQAPSDFPRYGTAGLLEEATDLGRVASSKKLWHLSSDILTLWIYTCKYVYIHICVHVCIYSVHIYNIEIYKYMCITYMYTYMCVYTSIWYVRI